MNFETKAALKAAFFLHGSSDDALLATCRPQVPRASLAGNHRRQARLKLVGSA